MKGCSFMVNKHNLQVMELFAGVGGFRLGLERSNPDLFNVSWANQWEPSRKSQDAFTCYTRNFNQGEHVNKDIAEISNEEFQRINPDMVVGGFPCQDYSVARSLSGEKGIQGKKGVLFWEIKRVLENSHPKYILLENVDRLLKSPSNQRGRDFAVMLATLNELDYDVEWRIINAADYGFSQRRRRVFIFAYKNSISFAKSQRKLKQEDIVFNKGFFAPTFPVEKEAYNNRIEEVVLPDDILDISDNFSFNFHPAGVMQDGVIYSAHLQPILKRSVTLGEILLDEKEIEETYYLSTEEEEKFDYLRGPKKIKRTTADGHEYYFSEGGMSLTDCLNKPGRTMLTSEGSKNRSTHIVDINNRKRVLTPIECERLNGFPDNWTIGMSDRMRYFCMGNALVVGLIELIGNRIEEIEENEQTESIQLDLLLN